MPSFKQLIRGDRKGKSHKRKKKDLKGNPFKKGVCMKVLIRTPRKPNSALRKVAKVRLNTKKIIYAHIGGEGHNLREYSKVLVRGGRIKDLPGMKYRLVRGVYDFIGLNSRCQSRSKYGAKKKY